MTTLVSTMHIDNPKLLFVLWMLAGLVGRPKWLTDRIFDLCVRIENEPAE